MLNEIIQTVKDNAYNIESFGKKKKRQRQIHGNIDQNYGFQELEGWVKCVDAGQIVQNFSFKINKFLALMYIMVTLVNNTVLSEIC